MGVVTARAAGVDEVVVCAPGGHPVILAACALCGVDEVYRVGGAQAIAALAYGTESDRARRRDRRARATSGCRRPSARSPATSASTASPGPSDVLVVAVRGRRRGARRARPARPGRARRRARSPSRSARTRRCSTTSPSSSRTRRDSGAAIALVGVPDTRDGARARRGVRARAPGADRAPRPRRWRRRCARAGCVFVGAARRHRVRRLRRRLQPHAADRRRRALRLRARTSRHFRRRMSEVRIGDAAARPGGRRRGDRAGRGIRPARSVDGGAGEWAPMSRRAEIARETAETRIRLSLDLDGTGAGERSTGVGFLDHMLDLLARHGRLDLDVDVSRRPADRRAPHGRGHRARARPGARRGARRPLAASPATATPSIPMDEARALCAIDISGRPLLVFEADLPPGGTGGFDHELADEFFRAVASTAKLTLHLEVQRGTNAHHMIEARVQGVRPRAAPGRRDRPGRGRRALDEGDAHRLMDGARRDDRDRRLRHGQPPLGREGRRARRRARRPERRPRRAARRRRAGPARRRRVPRRAWSCCATAASTSCCASARPRACRSSAPAWACSCCSTRSTEHDGADGPRPDPRDGPARSRRPG